MLVAAVLAAAALGLYVSTGVLGVKVPDLSTFNATTSAPQPTATAKAAPEEDKTPKAVVSHGANMRDGPSSTAGVVSSLTKGAEVAVLEQQGSWTLVHVSDGRKGWVFSEFLQLDAKDAAAKPSAAKAK
jgi:uncharacterized protein YgiM (DUF1202 family)